LFSPNHRDAHDIAQLADGQFKPHLPCSSIPKYAAPERSLVRFEMPIYKYASPDGLFAGRAGNPLPAERMVWHTTARTE